MMYAVIVRGYGDSRYVLARDGKPRRFRHFHTAHEAGEEVFGKQADHPNGWGVVEYKEAKKLPLDE